MPGNNGNHGKKGRSGRKGAYRELMDAERLWKIWTDATIPADIAAKMTAGEPLSLEETHIIKAQLGNDKILNRFFERIYPERVDLTTKGKELPTPILNALPGNNRNS